MDFCDKRVLVLGLAREGESLARFLASRGARVTVTDAAPAEALDERVTCLDRLGVEVVVGGHHPELVDDADLFFVSPGVPESSPVFAAARARGLPVRSMTTLFFELCPGPIIGITGSSGKTTTTSLIGHILTATGRDTVVGGNIGDPMLDLLPNIGSETLVVLELSSFQLDTLRRSPHVAVVTNISPNHLDRHGTMREYIDAKRHVVAHQRSRDFAVLNAGDAEVIRFSRETPADVRWFGMEIPGDDGATVRAGRVGLVEHGRFSSVLPVAEIPLVGRHNVENVLAAVAASALVGAEPTEMAKAIRSYRPPAHRLQLVAERGGVRFVDDSIATSPARAATALEALGAPVLLIAGGRDKNLPWDDLARLIARRARVLLLIGEATSLIEEAVRPYLSDPDSNLDPRAIERCSTLAEAVSRAAVQARPGEVVLLSPGCTSYDMFANFAERGDAFARAVEAVVAA
jgi:UDP-N-acetylmuramoylalanine--D-glutamate ligase